MSRWLIALISIAGCADRPASLRWSVEFESESLRTQAASVHAEIIRGGCEGSETVWDRWFTEPGVPGRVGELGRGRYGLSARALDEECVSYAAHCENVVVPIDEAVVVVMRAAAAVEECGPSECDGGRCNSEPMDGGTEDAIIPPDGGEPARPSCPDESELGCGPMVFVQAGTFTMGQEGSLQATPEQPEISVGGFYLDPYEVTVGRFRRFWEAGHPEPGATVEYPGGAVSWEGPVAEPRVATTDFLECTWSASAGSLEAHPINCVDWFAAQAFCVWDGGRLPTEAEWEFAARGGEGRTYPWGDATLCGSECGEADECLDLARVCRERTAEVGSYGAGATESGLYDLAGNVAEWAADPFEHYGGACWPGTAQVDPICGATGSRRAFRGGSWTDNVEFLRSAARPGIFAQAGQSIHGFRCARSAPGS